MLVVMKAHATEEQVRASAKKSRSWDIARMPCRERNAPRLASRETRAKWSRARWKKGGRAGSDQGFEALQTSEPRP